MLHHYKLFYFLCQRFLIGICHISIIYPQIKKAIFRDAFNFYTSFTIPVDNPFSTQCGKP